jgi:hypothetical protein
MTAVALRLYRIAQQQEKLRLEAAEREKVQAVRSEPMRIR